MTGMANEGREVSSQSCMPSVLMFSRHSKHPICNPQNRLFFPQWHCCCNLGVVLAWVTGCLYLHICGKMQVLSPVACCRFMARPRRRSMSRQRRREIIRPCGKFLEAQMCVHGGCRYRPKCSQNVADVQYRITLFGTFCSCQISAP